MHRDSAREKDPEEARVDEFLARMIRPGGALPPDDAGDAFARPARHKLKALHVFHREAVERAAGGG
jgi:hypothetical protein